VWPTSVTIDLLDRVCVMEKFPLPVTSCSVVLSIFEDKSDRACLSLARPILFDVLNAACRVCYVKSRY